MRSGILVSRRSSKSARNDFVRAYTSLNKTYRVCKDGKRQTKKETKDTQQVISDMAGSSFKLPLMQSLLGVEKDFSVRRCRLPRYYSESKVLKMISKPKNRHKIHQDDAKTIVTLRDHLGLPAPAYFVRPLADESKAQVDETSTIFALNIWDINERFIAFLKEHSDTQGDEWQDGLSGTCKKYFTSRRLE